MKQNVMLGGIGILIVVGLILLGRGVSSPVVGSIITGEHYTSTTTNSTFAASHRLLKTTYNTTASCEFGSIVIASSSATTLTIWDATSTTDVSSTTLVTMKAAVAEGTYTFDVACKRGVVVASPTGYNGQFVLTWK